MSINQERVTKWWGIHTMEYYMALKMNDLKLHATIWMNFINVMLSRRSWAKIVPTIRFHLYKVQIQVQLIYAVRSQDSGDLGGWPVTRGA